MKAGAVDLVVGRWCKILRRLNVKISEMTFFRGLLPVVSKNGIASDMQTFEWYSIRIVKKKHPDEAYLNYAKKMKQRYLMGFSRGGSMKIFLGGIFFIFCTALPPSDLLSHELFRSTPKALQRILVAPLSFSGHFADLEIIRKRYTEMLPDYIKAVSNGQLDLEVIVMPWIPMPHPISEYQLPSWRLKNIQNEKRPQIRLVRDSLALIEGMRDLKGFDGLMIAVGADQKALGRNGYLFRSSTGFGRLGRPIDQPVPPIDVHTWDCPFPSIAYALPKMAAGYFNQRAVVPTLYDYDAQSTPGPFGYANQWIGGESGMQYYSIHVGPWDIQSQHGIETKTGVLPQGMTSFTKIRLGWIKPEKIITVEKGDTREVQLAPLVNGEGGTLVVFLPIDEERYYLVENRQQEGVDRFLPSEGVLILKVDETIPEGKGPVRVVNAHPYVRFFQESPFKTGEIFRDPENGIMVKVLGKDQKDYRLEINRDPGRKK